MAEELKQVLEKTLSPNQADQNLAKTVLQSAYDGNYGQLVQFLSDFLRETSLGASVRQAAGLQLKNALVAKDEATRLEKLAKWAALSAEARAYVKANVLGALGTETSRPSQAAQCFAGIACAELPLGQWDEAIPAIMASVTAAGASEALKEASLEALGYVCQDIDPAVLQSRSNDILTAIVNGMKKEEPSQRVRLAATNALYNSLEFTHANFANDNERNLIMQVICEATQSADVQVSVAALQCLVKIMSLYYAYMEPYMGPALFSISVQAMKSPTEEVALQGIEFWSNVAEEEIELACEAEEAAAEGRPPESVSRFYAKGALKHLIPIITGTLTKQEEGDDEDEWNPPKAAGVSLMLLAQCVGDDVVHELLPFITNNIGSEDWRQREAAIMAFGSILEGPDPDKLQVLVQQALPRLIGALQDPHTVVRDTAAWTISKVCETCKMVVVMPDALGPLLPALSAAISQEPRVASNACWAIGHLAEAALETAKETGQVDPEGNPHTYILSSVFDPMVSELLKTTDRPDAHLNNLRIAAYEALMSLIKNSPKDCYQTVQKTTMLILKKMEQLLSMESSTMSSQERSQFRDLQSLLCGTLQSVLRKMDKGDAEAISDMVMAALTRIMADGTRAATSNGTANGAAPETAAQGGVVEDALMAVSTLIELLGPSFARFLPSLKPFLVAGLSNHSDSMVCQAAVGSVVDLCRALEAGVAEHLDQLMELLIGILQDSGTEKHLKPCVLSAFGDVALAIGPAFSRYTTHTLSLLGAAAATPVPADRTDYDEMEYVDSLREAVLEGYTGITQGLKSASPPNPQDLAPLQPEVPRMVALAEAVAAEKDSSEAVLGAAAGVVGDLATAFGLPVLPALETQGVGQLLTRCRKAKSSKPKSLANWATKELKKLKAKSTAA